jgi:hypothetical protein
VEVAPIIEKMLENRFRWFGDVERRPVDSVTRKVDHMKNSQITRGRGRSRKIIMKDLEINELDQNMVYDRTL